MKILPLDDESYTEAMRHFKGYFSFDILPYTAVSEFEQGEYIFHEGDRAEKMYYLFEGLAKLYLTHQNGRISLIHFIEKGSYIGEIEFLGTQPFTNAVQALKRCRCFSIDTKRCNQQILNDKRFLKELCILLSGKTISNLTNYTHSLAYPLENRLAKFILMTEHGRWYTEKHTEVSEYLGVSYRHLLYVLADFCKRRILSKHPSGYRLIDIDELKRLAKQ